LDGKTRFDAIFGAIFFPFQSGMQPKEINRLIRFAFLRVERIEI
jgi:hypothetical protein